MTRATTERWGRRRRTLAVVLGAALIATGVVIVAIPLTQTWLRSREDDRALQEWRDGGSQRVAGPAPASTVSPPAACNPSGAAYALVTFPSLTVYGYADVAGHGTWDLLTERSMVHYETSAAPGEQGNVIIAFHREPRYEHIDELGVGDIVQVQDRTCTVYRYRVTQRWDIPPEQVTQLGQTAGHDLTLVTCTPWWKDDRRLVWRASLLEG